MQNRLWGDRKILNDWDIKAQDVYFAELHLDAIIPQANPPKKYNLYFFSRAIGRKLSITLDALTGSFIFIFKSRAA